VVGVRQHAELTQCGNGRDDDDDQRADVGERAEIFRADHRTIIAACDFKSMWAESSGEKRNAAESGGIPS
jgi:hypothetical protein